MDTTRLGSHGPSVPPFALGTMYLGTRVPPRTALTILDAALDTGATFLDTANNYAFWVDGGTGDESESLLGRWFASRPGSRDRVTLATKIGARPRPGSRSLDDALGLSASAIRAQIEDSLTRLGTDHVDLLYAHVDDVHVPIEETLEGLIEEARRGTTRFIGCSNLSASRLAAALGAAPAEGPGYCALQQRFTYLTAAPGADLSPHVLLDEEAIDVATSHGVGLVGYSPLLSGAYTRADRPLPQAYRHGSTPDQLAALARASDATGLDTGQVVLAWMAQRGIPVLPVVGVSSTEQLASAVTAASTPLPAEVLADLERTRHAL